MSYHLAQSRATAHPWTSLLVLIGSMCLKRIIVVFLYFVVFTKVILECYYRSCKTIVPYTSLSSPKVSLFISMIAVVKIRKPMLLPSD